MADDLDVAGLTNWMGSEQQLAESKTLQLYQQQQQNKLPAIWDDMSFEQKQQYLSSLSPRQWLQFRKSLGPIERAKLGAQQIGSRAQKDIAPIGQQLGQMFGPEGPRRLAGHAFETVSDFSKGPLGRVGAATENLFGPFGKPFGGPQLVAPQGKVPGAPTGQLQFSETPVESPGVPAEIGDGKEDKKKKKELSDEDKGLGQFFLGLGMAQAQRGTGAPSINESIGGLVTAAGGMIKMTTGSPAGMGIAMLGTLLNMYGQRQSSERLREHKQGWANRMSSALTSARSFRR